MENTKFILKRYTGETIDENEGIYYAPIYEIFGYEVDLEEVKVIERNDGKGTGWKGECSPIKISDMEDMIARIKEEGATHIEVMFHCDHDNYCISGVEIREMNEDEINLIKIVLESEKEAEIMKLEEEAHRLVNKLNEIKKKLKNI
jgi:hypothetical protein